MKRIFEDATADPTEAPGPEYSFPPDGPPPTEADLYRLIGERVLQFRHRAGLTQLALAERVGVTRTSITNLEQGKQRPPLAQLFRIAAALDLADYRRLLPTPEELAVAALGPSAGMLATAHPFWGLVWQLLKRTFSSRTEHVTVVGGASFDSVEVLVDDTNPLRPHKALIWVFPRPEPVRRAHVLLLASQLGVWRADRGILITSGTFVPEAVASAAERKITLINGVAVTHLQAMLSTARGAGEASELRDAVCAARSESAHAPSSVPRTKHGQPQSDLLP